MGKKRLKLSKKQKRRRIKKARRIVILIILAILCCLIFGASATKYTTPENVDDNENERIAINPDLNADGFYSELEDLGEPHFIKNVPLLNQYDEGLPTGCEGVSLTMVLNFMGFDVSANEICNIYMPQGWRETDVNSRFIGNPNDITAFGCNAPVIVDTAYNFLNTVANKSIRVINLTGGSIDDLRQEVQNNHPVIVWATNKFIQPTLKEYNGFSWLAGEHCMVLTGYDDKNLYINDPINGYISVDYKTFEQRWADLGRQAVVIH